MYWVLVNWDLLQNIPAEKGGVGEKDEKTWQNVDSY